MNQQNSASEQNYLDYLVTVLHRKKKQSQSSKPEGEANLQKLYETMNNVVSGLDQNINECKKYNEAKIHRKYQILVKDQQKRITFLQQKIKQQQRARSPSKQYIQDLLDKLIHFKFQIQKLTKDNTQLTQQNADLRKKLQIYQNNMINNNHVQEEQPEQKPHEQSTQISGFALKNEVTNFLNLKYQLRKNDQLQKTKFQRFLKKVKDRLHGFTMRQFLQNIDQWSSQMNRNLQAQKTQETSNFLTRTYMQKTPNTDIQHRNLIVKTQVRNRRTISNRHFGNNKSYNDYILR